MFCKKCGEYMNDSAQVCPNCGNPQQQNMPVASVGLGDAVKLFFTRYADFQGRSRRSEFWWSSLVIGLVGGFISNVLPDLAWIWNLAILVPSVAICVRRLHDAGKSGWWYAWNLLPVVGQIILLVQYLKDSAPDNQWGPNPKCYRPR